MNQYLEKFLWLLLPMLLSSITYVWTTLEKTKEDVIALRLETALEREKLRSDVISYASDNRERIAKLEAKVKP